MSKDVKRRKYWVNPHVHCSCNCEAENDEHEEGCVETEEAYRLIYELPGVKKEDISIRIVKNGLRLNAIRDSHVEYVNEYPFLVDGDPETSTAFYEEGLLKINVPIVGKDPFKEIKTIKIK